LPAAGLLRSADILPMFCGRQNPAYCKCKLHAGNAGRQKERR